MICYIRKSEIKDGDCIVLTSGQQYPMLGSQNNVLSKVLRAQARLGGAGAVSISTGVGGVGSVDTSRQSINRGK